MTTHPQPDSPVETVDAGNLPWEPELWSDADAELYERGLAQSDYERILVPLLRTLLSPVGSLLDIGAGTGNVGRGLAMTTDRWTAVEPNAHMAQALWASMTVSANQPCALLRRPWESLADLDLPLHDTVLCAHLPGMTSHPVELWDTARRCARKHICWVISTERGPYSCLSGFLPEHLEPRTGPAWHERVLEQLDGKAPAPAIEFFDWTFRLTFKSEEEALRVFQPDQTPPGGERKQAALKACLQQQLQRVPDGLMAAVPKRNAILFWNLEEATL